MNQKGALKPAVYNIIKDIIGLSKENFDSVAAITAVSISSDVFHKISHWIDTDDLRTYTYYNKKNGHMQVYTTGFSIRRVFFEDKEYFKLLSTGANGSLRDVKLDEKAAKTPSVNDVFRHILNKYPSHIYRVEYCKPTDIYDYDKEYPF